MSTATQQENTDLEQGEIIVSHHDMQLVVRWTCGTAAIARGLTLQGISRALVATAGWLDGLEGTKRRAAAAAPQIRVATHLWEVPAVPGHAGEAADMMRAVINAEGSIGVLPS